MNLLGPEECPNDSEYPFRIMFWEHVSPEYVDCLAAGITPIFFGSAPLETYEARETVLTPFRFHNPSDLYSVVSRLGSEEGILRNGTLIDGVAKGNRHLVNLYWRTQPFFRAALAASSLQMSTRFHQGAFLFFFEIIGMQVSSFVPKNSRPRLACPSFFGFQMDGVWFVRRSFVRGGVIHTGFTFLKSSDHQGIFPFDVSV